MSQISVNDKTVKQKESNKIQIFLLRFDEDELDTDSRGKMERLSMTEAKLIQNENHQFERAHMLLKNQ